MNRATGNKAAGNKVAYGLLVALSLAGLCGCSSLTEPQEFKVDKDSVIAARTPPPPPAPPPAPAAANPRPGAAINAAGGPAPKKKGG